MDENGRVNWTRCDIRKPRGGDCSKLFSIESVMYSTEVPRRDVLFGIFVDWGRFHLLFFETVS